MKKLTIVARYNEDISWTKTLDSDIFIYNKGNDWPWEDIPRVDIPNYGRETETYVRSVIEFYDLLDDYDLICFVQGNPFDHYDFPIESINECNKDHIQFLANSIVAYTHDELNYHFNINNIVIAKLFNREFNFKANFNNLVSEDKNEDLNNLRGAEIASTLLFAYLLNLKTYDNGIMYPAGAQYIIPTKFIKNKTFAWWEEFYKLIINWQILVPNDDIGAYCERIWPLIWKTEADFQSSS
jgi:hypothetical protein